MYSRKWTFLLILFSIDFAYSENIPDCGTMSATEEDRSKWPWHAALYRKPRNITTIPKVLGRRAITYACGGTLVNRNTVLTSAHCVSDHDMKPYPKELQILILSPAGSDFISSADNQNSQIFKIDTVIIHPEFDYPTMSNNIAVIKLQVEATINQFVRPICFPYNNTKDFEVTKYQLQPGRNGMLAGFGLDINSGNISDMLKEFDFSVESEMDCFNDFRVEMKSTQFCAGYSGFIPLIKSNGGGLVFPVPQVKLQFYLQGIVCHSKYDENEKAPLKFLGSKSNIVLIKIAAFTEWLQYYMDIPVGDIRTNFLFPTDSSVPNSTSTTTTTTTTTTTPAPIIIPTSPPTPMTTTTTTTTTTPTPTTTTTKMTTTTPTTTTTEAAILITSGTTSTTTEAPRPPPPPSDYPLSLTIIKKPSYPVSKPGGIKKNGVKCPPIVPTEDSNILVTCTLTTDNSSKNKSCATETIVGVRATFGCKPYYRRTVSNPFFSKTCLPNGQWSHGEKTFSCDLDCGISDKVTEKMIVNGSPSSTRKWPWHTALFRKTSGTFKYICGGALIRQNVIITAAHCVTDDIGRGLEPNLFQVVLGAISSDLSENYEDKQPQIFRVTEIHTHPQYNYVSVEADVALITLKKDVRITRTVRPACFPYSEEDDALTDYMLSPGNYGVIAGFGFDESWKMSPTLKELQMPVVSYRDCSKVLGLQYAPTSQFCAGYVNGSSPCEGDSGGALVFPSDTIPVRYYIQGLVSYGTLAKTAKRCNNNKYTVFTRVASFNSWVTDKLRDISSDRQ